MKHDSRYSLEPYKGRTSRYTCPGCGKKNEFARYLDMEMGQHLSPEVGRCNREDSCAYHYTPKQYFENNPALTQSYTPAQRYYQSKAPAPPKPASLIPSSSFRDSLQGYDCNHFATYLTALFGSELAGQLVGRYYVGSSQHWQGATAFFQIDTKGKVRAGKIMLYSPVMGKRVKEPYSHLTWMHKVLNLADYNLQQCFFGEHLLSKEPGKPVAIVESEKTAIIASGYLPEFVWLATGSKGGLSLQKCHALQGRKVVLYPDLNGFKEWSNRATELASITAVAVSDLLERKATDAERAQGLDLADYLIRMNREGIKPTEGSRLKRELVTPSACALKCIEKPLPAPDPVWDIAELEAFFKTAALPDEIQLNKWSRIKNPPLFLQSHFATVRANNGRRGALPYLERLQQLSTILENTVS